MLGASLAGSEAGKAVAAVVGFEVAETAVESQVAAAQDAVEYGVGLGPSMLSDRRWAEEMFGKARLGDCRRTRRLVDLAEVLAGRPNESIAASTKGDKTRQEGSYRFIRNDAVGSQDITEAGCDAALRQCKEKPLILAIQDSTELSYRHASVRDELGPVGNGRSKCARGFVVHTTLAVDGIGGVPIGIMDQVRWMRPNGAPSRDERKSRPYREKESFKWQAACERMQLKLGEWDNTVVVGDRESDIYELLAFCLRTKLRFVFRGAQNRKLLDDKERLLARVASQPVLGRRTVLLGQRGGQGGDNGQHARPARAGSTVEVEYRACRVPLTIAYRDNAETPETIEVGVVLVSEVGKDPTKPKDGLHWLLLTSESVDSLEAAERVIDIYETRWVIEEYHKAYKSGCRVEEAQMQEADNLERLAAILAFVALRITQVAILARQQPSAPAQAVLDSGELFCLKKSLSPKIRYHNPEDTVGWVLEAIGRLGGWTDTKRIGHPGWEALLKGWLLLQARVEGFKIAMALWQGEKM